ncbi:hypothetical protein KUTeg_007816 [Tegillarca granosa]|uniref:Uncharacterized protein n=1 Tax=Tegillarca granosa TaxID=220873 RepID=A0ABQ9FED5_TEGGR|nr:hypothetical protein KUTeg_007816 [Tegillarca granosa]
MSDCTPLEGYKFQLGAYKCTCKMSYEYPWKDGREWYLGSFIEKEYTKKMAGIFNIYDGLKCRVSRAPAMLPSLFR